MAYRRRWDTKQSLIRAGLAAGSLAVLQSAGPFFWANGGINYLSIGAGAVLAVAGTYAVSDGLYLVGRFFNWLDAITPRGHKGTAGWAKSLWALRRDLIAFPGLGPYFGSMRKSGGAVFADFDSNAVCLGPNASGKDTSSVGPNLLSIRDSKTVVDFKGDLACVYADTLRARGEEVRILNFGELFTDILGQSDHYNPLRLVAENFFRSGGLHDVSDDLAEFSLQLYPEPSGAGSGNDNRYFRDGSRNLISFAILIMVLVKGYDATLGDVLQLLNDRESFLWHALWAAGRLESDNDEAVQIPLHESPWAAHQDADDLANFAEYLRGLAAGIADLLSSEDSRTLDSFLTGATQAMTRFNITTRAHKISGKSSFRFADQKEDGRTVTVFLVADSSRMEAQRPILEMVQFCMLNEWKRHAQKQKPVYLIGNEAGNFKIYGLASLLTWGRAYGIKLFLYLQNFAAFEKTYDTQTLETLLSEQQILQVLPGQKNPKTLKIIEEMLGRYSYMGRSHQNEGRGPLGLKGGGMQEHDAPLMTADQIRRCDKAILFVRKNKPLLTEVPSIAAIAPWRAKQAINPFYNKPYREPVRLRIWRATWLGQITRQALGAFDQLKFWRRS